MYVALITSNKDSSCSPRERRTESCRVKCGQESWTPRRQQNWTPCQQRGWRQERRWRRPRALAFLTLHLPAGRIRFRDNLDGCMRHSRDTCCALRRRACTKQPSSGPRGEAHPAPPSYLDSLLSSGLVSRVLQRPAPMAGRRRLGGAQYSQ